MRRSTPLLRPIKILSSGLLIVPATTIVFALHGKALTTGLVALISVMLIAFRGGFLAAIVSAVAAVACLDFFYMPPIFSLYEHDPQDWISSAVFVIVALTAGHFVTRLQAKTAQTELEKMRVQRLYLTSRDIILMSARDKVLPQLSRLIMDTFPVSFVGIWDDREAVMERRGLSDIDDVEIKAICYSDASGYDPVTRRFTRVLRIGTRGIGSLCMIASESEDELDPRSVDAIAFLTSIALERAQALIAESNAEAAKRGEELRSIVLDGLAHAFKTPLATIQSASSGLLAIDRLAGEEAELVSIIDDQASRLSRLTTQVLQTAKLDDSELVLRKGRLDAEDLFGILAEEFRASREYHLLDFIDHSNGAFAWGDLRLIKMALEQLLDNAMKYSCATSKISITATATDAELVFDVANEGSFIPPEQRYRVFERFYRAPGSEYRAAGTGIGLAVVKRITDAHKGRVWVDSEHNGRTIFHLAIPRAGKDS